MKIFLIFTGTKIDGQNVASDPRFCVFFYLKITEWLREISRMKWRQIACLCPLIFRLIIKPQAVSCFDCR